MLVVFDIDGTIIGGESADWRAFGDALNSVLGFTPEESFYTALQDVTAQRIAEAAVAASGQATGAGIEDRIHAEYLRQLRLAHAASASAFPARPGAENLLSHLVASQAFDVAFATGDWFSTISFKLTASGLDLSGLALATSSDASSRADIIRCAAARAGRSLSDVVYVGDGSWDLRTCRQLGIPFVGTGHRADRLRELGAEHIVEPLDIAAFMTTLDALAGR
jgi:phosphoglycolate phosphatase-like HAD superfamily hydrolase